MSRLSLGALLPALVLAACQKPAPPPPAPPPAPPKEAPTAQAAPAAEEGPHLLFGVAMPFGSTVGVEDAQATSSWLSKTLGTTVEARLFDYDDLATAIAEKKIDFAFMPPLSYVKAMQKGKPKLVRQAMHGGAMSYRSVLFVRKDSPIMKTDDMRGKKLAWIGGGSTSGRLVPAAWFASRKIDPDTFFGSLVALPNHGKVCKTVFNHDADVGASFSDPKEEGRGDVDGCRPALQDQISELRIIWASAPIPNDVVVVREDLPAPLLKKLGDAFDHIGSTEEGKEVLKTGFQSDGFYPVTDSVFDSVRELLNRVAPAAETAAKPATP